MSLQPTELEGGRVLSADDMELLQRQVEIQRQLIALAKTNGLALYRPHYLQHKFHSSAAKRRGAFTGNRFGKSKMDGAETAAWAVGERTWYKAEFDVFGVDLDSVTGKRTKVWRCHHDGGENHPLVRQGIPPFATKQLIVCANWNKVEEIWTDQSADRPGYIWQFLPKGFGRGYVNHAGVIDHIVCTNGAIIDFMSVDSFKKSSLVAESSDYDRVVFDEPAPKALWKGVARGLVDRNGQADFALTALQEVWIVEKFTGDPATPTGDDDDRPFRLDLRFSFRASMLDNPHLEDQSIIDYENELTEDEKQCRINGVPLEYSGLIYKEFSHEKHVMKVLPDGWEDWTKPAPKTLLYARVDTHPVKPHAVSFYAVGPAEIPIQCHEIWLACDADTLAETINTYVRSTGCFLAGIKVEPAAWIKDPTNRTVSIAKVLSKHGLFVRPASKDLSNGILAVRSALKRQKFFITPNCTRTLWEFSRYRYDVEDGKPVDENDHFMENLYRLIIDGVKFFDPDSNNFPITDEEFVGNIDNLSNVNW